MSPMRPYRFRSIAAMTLIAALFVLPSAAQAQLVVSPQADLQQLAASITGPGVTISNPVITCHGLGYGEFTYTGTALSAEEGVIRLLYLDPELFRGRDGPEAKDFSSPVLWRMFSELRKRAADGGTLSVAGLSEVLGPEETSLLTDILQKPETPYSLARIMKDHKGYVARQANKILNRTDTFWFPEYYDQ